MSFKIVKGDVTQPIGSGVKVIPHCCNDIGSIGAGVALAIKQRWPIVDRKYREWAQATEPKEPFVLGQIQTVRCADDIIVINMIGQHRLRIEGGRPPIRYVALIKTMMRVYDFVKTGMELSPQQGVSIHCPKFGSALAGGNWEVIEQLIHEVWVDKGLNVVVYEYP